MVRVRQLGYIGYQVSEPAAWDRLLRGVLGLQLRDDSTDRCQRYRVDERHHRLSVYPAERDGLACIGWEVDERAQLDVLAGRLQAGGVAVRRGTRAECDERGVMEFIAFAGPDAVPLEVFFGAVLDNTPFVPSRPMSGFATGANGLGHVVFWARDPDAAVNWYRDHLGFMLSDYIYWDEARATFLHCNPRHHSLALMNECFGGTAGQLNHLMLEARSIDDVGRAYDTCADLGLSLILGMGRHTNDRMTSFYVRTPSGSGIEFGWGGLHIDDADWEVKYYDKPMLWGHRPEATAGTRVW